MKLFPSIAAIVALWLNVASAATLTINGAQTFQTVEGFGTNANTTSWDNGAVKPAIDLLVDALGSTIVRAVIEEMDWEAVNDDADAGHFNWSY